MDVLVVIDSTLNTTLIAQHLRREASEHIGGYKQSEQSRAMPYATCAKDESLGILLNWIYTYIY